MLRTLVGRSGRIRICRVGPEEGAFKWLAKVARLARPSWREAAVAELQGSGPGGPVLARGRFYWASLRVARWVANRCVRGLLCVAPRCSPSVSLLVTLHSCWSVEVPALHGMQEVRGSNPRSSTSSRACLEYCSVCFRPPGSTFW
jgi:hypothetical protein